MIALSHVTKHFGEKAVLQDFSLQLGENGVTAIVGKNGSGKTTLLRILAGLEKKYAGEVSTGGRIAYVFQDLRLVPTLTALENVALVLDNTRRAEAIRYLRIVGLENEADSLPGKLSGGMQQRLALARAFAYGGDLLLLDEPFSALDEEWKQNMLDAVRDYAQTRPVVLVTHDASDVAYLNCKSVRLD
ncbi:MAG: ABC transporter ATP-binding protein [Oscillospiraceae bacterium]|nr:ABC transporter ATP-binding protein [Oscillospiraceae bacterium]